MAKFILGKKVNMTQKFLEDGTVVAVTELQAGPCTVVQVKGEKDGYNAVQVGFGKKNKVSKSIKGHLKDLDNFQYLREFRLADGGKFAKGKIFDLSSFAVGDILNIQAVSKGKGFQGVVKRHGFHGSPASHGHKDQLRMPGSIGATDAARVFKGTRMGGRMGTDTVTVKNLEVVEVDVDNNIIFVKGAVPGARHALVKIFCNEGELSFVEPKKEEVKKEEPKIESKEEKSVADKKEEVSGSKEAPVENSIEKKEEVKETPAEESSKEEVKETPVEESSKKETKANKE